MHCHSGYFVRFYIRNDCCGCCQNKQDGSRRISSLRRKTGWVFANFLARGLYYKVSNHLITKNKQVYHARNVNRWKGSVEPHPFIGLLVLDVINWFIFCQGLVIYKMNSSFHLQWKKYTFDCIGCRKNWYEKTITANQIATNYMTLQMSRKQ